MISTKLESLFVALATGKAVSFIYDDKTRIVEVHAIGHSTKDNSLVMRGFQVAGEASRPLPVWALYTLDKIEGLGLTFVDSQAPRPGFRAGDKQMSIVLAQLELPEEVA